MSERNGPKQNGAWIGFLAMSFVVVGLAGLFASFAAPLPLERAMARDTALDEALSAAAGPDAQAAIEALRPRLDDSAAALLPVGGDMPARIAREREAMHARFLAEAAATDTRLHWLIVLVTLTGAIFGAAILGFSRAAAGK
jgi:hypothetical protein